MLIKIGAKYNEKLDYKAVYFLTEQKGDENYTESVEIYYNKQTVTNEWGKRFISNLQVYEYVFKSDVLGKEQFEYCAKLAGVSARNKVLKTIALNDLKLENLTVKQVISLLKRLIKNRPFETHNEPLSFIIFNAVLKKIGYVPIIFTKSYLESIIKQIKSGADESQIYYMLATFENANENYVKSYAPISKSEVIKRLKGQSERIKNEFGVKNLWLYGSFAKDEQTEFSDVDLLIEFKEQQSENVIIGLKKFTQELTCRRVDLQDENNVKHTAFYKRINYKIKIIG